MPLGIEPVQFGIVIAVLLAGSYIWLLAGEGRWYAVLSRRFLYGVPWGTLVSILGVVAFYLFAQSGLAHWDSPVTLPFRNWSYFYPVGMLTSGFAHASPSHLMGNMIGTVVLAPVVEYAWSHYPPREQDPQYEYPPPGKVRSRTAMVGYDGGPYRRHPWVRALVVFPAAVFVVSILTSIFAFGWSLGFSGTVFAFGGFAVVYFPLAAIIAMVGFTGTSVLVFAFQDPILRVTAEPGAPGPPGWWGVNVQAHLLGFLIGVILALVLLQYRGRGRRPEWVFFAALVFGLTRQLYSFATSGGEDVFLQLRGVGVIFVLGLAILLGATVAADEQDSPNPFWNVSRLTNWRLLHLLWVVAIAVLAWVLWTSTVGEGNVTPLAFGFAPLVLILLLLPAFRIAEGTSRRQLLLVALSVLLVVVAIPSFPGNLLGMSDDPVPEGETISIEDYEITYAEDVEHGRIAINDSGLIVVSEQRRIWSAVADEGDLEHDGEATVAVGGIGWREAVTATRTGWDVTGGDPVYVVDLAHDGESVRSFSSERSEARALISGRTVAVEPHEGEFRLTVTRAGAAVGETAIPAENETATVDDLVFSTERPDDTLSVFVQTGDTRVLVAEKESYD